MFKHFLGEDLQNPPPSITIILDTIIPFFTCSSRNKILTCMITPTPHLHTHYMHITYWQLAKIIKK